MKRGWLDGYIAVARLRMCREVVGAALSGGVINTFAVFMHRGVVGEVGVGSRC